MAKKNWYDQKYRINKPDGTTTEKKFYDINPEDAFYVWNDYNMKVNNKRVNYKFWDMCKWEITPENYFKFMRKEGYKIFIYPHKILSGEGYPENHKPQTILYEGIFEDNQEYLSKENTLVGVYTRLHEFMAFINNDTSHYMKFEKPKNPFRPKPKPCSVCGSKTQKDCTCKNK